MFYKYQSYDIDIDVFIKNSIILYCEFNFYIHIAKELFSDHSGNQFKRKRTRARRRITTSFPLYPAGVGYSADH